MKKILYLLACTSLLAACGAETQDSQNEAAHSHDMAKMYKNDQYALKDNEGLQPLTFPKVLQPTTSDGENVAYTLIAQKGTMIFMDGIKSETYGYNGDFLGPTIRLKKGQHVAITLKNDLDEPTTFHWHGLEVAGDVADGGPHHTIKAGQTTTIHFTVNQDAATLWYHPHPMGSTAKQVYKGLAGLMYIEDSYSENLDLPNNYGKNDLPLILQDRTFIDGKIQYEDVANTMSTLGDTVMINGKVNPKLTVAKEKIRLRILNGSNALTYQLQFNNHMKFQLLATDGGFLNTATQMKKLSLSPGERAEILVDLSAVKNSTITLMNGDTKLLPIDLTGEQHVASTSSNQLNDRIIDENLRHKTPDKTITMEGTMNKLVLNGQSFDDKRIDFKQKQGVTEVWEIENAISDEGAMAHPFHIHGTQFAVLSVDGQEPPANLQGLKDTILVQPNQKIRIAVHFKEKGLYMFHCHILEHEDAGMMGQIKVD
ncbi:MAG: multicopper oxidase domain-containing protein [Kurthia sp.]|nr:multicopper oxidase domain-containing protein [Candidatus Kurthia equi]